MSTYRVRLNRATITGSIPSKKSAHRMVSYAGLLKRAYIYLISICSNTIHLSSPTKPIPFPSPIKLEIGLLSIPPTFA